MSLTQEEFDILNQAHEIWRREQTKVTDFLIYRAKASGSWAEGTIDFIDEVSDRGIVFATIKAQDAGEWDTLYTSVLIEDLLNLDLETAKYKAVYEEIEEARKVKSEEEAAERRRQQYEKLKEEFDGA